MTPLEEVEALYEGLLLHYGDGKDREIRAAAKLLLVAIDRMQRHAGPGWRALIDEYLDLASREPEKFALMVEKNRTPQDPLRPI
jgi:hypothetical protein